MPLIPATVFASVVLGVVVADEVKVRYSAAHLEAEYQSKKTSLGAMQ